jgi:hypothetical protein
MKGILNAKELFRKILNNISGSFSFGLYASETKSGTGNFSIPAALG